jgi:hypothetical protein
MHRKFEELGFNVSGSTYGHFTGEAEWDVSGQVIAIELEVAGFSGKPLMLEIGELVRERRELRRKYGTGFLEETEPAVREHARKWLLFEALSDALRDVFAEDVDDHLSAVRADARATRRSGSAA